MADVPMSPPAPWTERVLRESPLPAGWTGVLLAASLVLAFLGFELVFGRFANLEVDSFREDLRVGVVLCLIAAYLPAAWLQRVSGARRTAEELAPALRPGDAAGAVLLRETGRFDRAALRRAGFAGIATLVVTLVLVDFQPSPDLGISQMSPEAFIHRILVLFIGWFGGRSAYATWVESKRLSELGRTHLEIDLLDLSPVAPLIRQGLRQALVTIGIFSLLALMFYDVNAAPNLVWFLVAASVAFLVLAAAALLLPVRGVHEAIAREKQRELARVNREIRLARGAGEAGGGGVRSLRDSRPAPEGAQPRLGDWVAYRGLVAEVPEWPIDAPTLRRFALYLAIPLGSWLGGALVERLVDALLA